jgi:hypothetical protein
MTDTELIDYLAGRFAAGDAFAIETNMIGARAVEAITASGQFPNTQEGLRDLYRQAFRARLEEMASE